MARIVGWAGGTSSPVFWFWIISAGPPMLDAMTGFAHAMASIMAFPKGSPSVGKQKMSHC